MCGIFGYYNFKISKDRKAILELLFTGLRRLEYRGYDSAGISVDADDLLQLAELGQPGYSPNLDGKTNGYANGGTSGMHLSVGSPPPVSCLPGASQLGAMSLITSPRLPSENGDSVSNRSSAGGERAAIGRSYSGGMGRDYSGQPAAVPLVIKSPGKVDALVALAYQELADSNVDLDKVRCHDCMSYNCLLQACTQERCSLGCECKRSGLDQVGYGVHTLAGLLCLSLRTTAVAAWFIYHG